MQRRTFMIGAAATAALANTGRPVFAADRPFTFTSWGGSLSDSEKNSFIDPFAASKGIKVINTSPTETAKIIAMVEAQKVEWDLVCVGGVTVWQGEEKDFLAPLDMSKIPNAKALPAGMVAPRGIATSTGATVIAHSKTAFPDGGPQSWADFWDVKRFPGARGLYKYFYYNYEAAVLAAGLKASEVYPYTKEKKDIAFGKIKELKPNIKVWWGSGAQPPQLLTSGELAASSAWTGRMLAASADGAPIGFTFKDGVAWANWWVVPKGSPYADVAYEALNFTLAPEQQKKLLALKTYGPVVSSATDGAPADVLSAMVMAPQNIKDMVILDEKQAWLYTKDVGDQWNQLMMQ